MNLDEICTTLKSTTDRLLAGELDLKIAAEVHNGLGKIIRAQTAAVAYAAVHSSNASAKRIPFFEESLENPLMIAGGKSDQDA